MWYPATVATPSPEPITATQCKLQLQIDDSDTGWDSLLAIYIPAAREFVENWTAARIASRSGVTLRCDSFDDFARLAEGPVSSVASITYVDVDGATQTLSSSVYEVRADGLETAIVLKPNQGWPATQPGSRITVTATIGFATVPPMALAAMLLLIGQWFANREATNVGNIVNEMPLGFVDLLVNLRRNA